MMRELGLNTKEEHYFDLVPWQSLAAMNHNFLLTERRRHYLRYAGGLTFFEVRDRRHAISCLPCARPSRRPVCKDVTRASQCSAAMQMCAPFAKYMWGRSDRDTNTEIPLSHACRDMVPCNLAMATLAHGSLVLWSIRPM